MKLQNTWVSKKIQPNQIAQVWQTSQSAFLAGLCASRSLDFFKAKKVSKSRYRIVYILFM